MKRGAVILHIMLDDPAQLPEGLAPTRRRVIPLAYSTPSSVPERPAGNVPYIAQLAIGFGAFYVAMGAWGLAIGMLAYALRANGAVFGLVYGLVPMVALLTGLARVARSRWRWRGLGVGILIGVGLFLLAVGVCGAIIRSL